MNAPFPNSVFSLNGFCWSVKFINFTCCVQFFVNSVKSSSSLIHKVICLTFLDYFKKFSTSTEFLFMHVVYFFFRFFYILITIILKTLRWFHIAAVLGSDYVDSFIPWQWTTFLALFSCLVIFDWLHDIMYKTTVETDVDYYAKKWTCLLFCKVLVSVEG